MQSLFEGTSGSPAPPEVVMVMFCHKFKTSPERVRNEWSPYELKVALDYLQLMAESEQDQVDQAKSEANRRR